MEGGATGSEIVMALGWTAARYLEAGAEGEMRVSVNEPHLLRS
jgi:hypothetical protein